MIPSRDEGGRHSPYSAFIARCKRGGYAGGPKRAAFWRELGFPNLVLARAAKADKRRQRRLEEWKQQELKRTPFALLDEPPPELAPPRPLKRQRAVH